MPVYVQQFVPRNRARQAMPEWVAWQMLCAIQIHCDLITNGPLPPSANVQTVLKAVRAMASNAWTQTLAAAFDLALAGVANDLRIPYETARRLAGRNCFWGGWTFDSRYRVRNGRLYPPPPVAACTPTLVLVRATQAFETELVAYIESILTQRIPPGADVSRVLDDIKRIVTHAGDLGRTAPFYFPLKTFAEQHDIARRRANADARAKKLCEGYEKIGALWKARNPALAAQSILDEALRPRAHAA